MPKLKKGEIAPGVEARIEKVRQNVLRRLQIFNDLSVGDKTSDKTILRHFITMDELASWNAPEIGITPVSAKTLRKYLEEMFQGGVCGFRKEIAHLKVTSGSECNVTKSYSLDLASEVRRQTEREAAATLEMTARYLDLLERLRKLAMHNENADKQLHHHLSIFGEVRSHLRMVK